MYVFMAFSFVGNKLVFTLLNVAIILSIRSSIILVTVLGLKKPI